MNKLSLFIILTVAATGFIACVSNKDKKLTASDSLAIAESFLGMKFTPAERDSMVDGVKERMKNAVAIHQYSLSNEVPPATDFNPRPRGFKVSTEQRPIEFGVPEDVTMPDDRNKLAFFTIAQLSQLIKAKKISSLELTSFFIDRLKKYGDTLQCVITITEDLAIQQAKAADEALAKGKYLGPLHGIPYGAKDLLAVEGYKTTWGAAPFKDQQLEGDATVIKKLENAGAVLVAKLTLGALAMGDIWYGGITKNPWNLEQGSSGSSAGSAAATAAGLVPFAIGTETWGSIVSPSTRCGTTGLRPTFGRVSRSGAMALSWSMDKIGPIAKTAQDCAIVFDVMRGADEKDRTVVDAAFNFDANDNVSTYKVAYLKSVIDSARNYSNDSAALEVFKEMGIELLPIDLPDDIPVGALSIILGAEASAAFDELTRNNIDDALVNQKKNAWPNYFRASRYISGADYVNANRIRYKLIEEVNFLFKDYDAVITSSFGGGQLLMTNLTGNPCVVLPNGFDDEGAPTSFSILGNLYDEGKILRLAMAYQARTEVDEKHPEMFVR